MKPFRVMISLSVMVVLLAGCGGNKQASGGGKVVVYAAASLTEAFNDMKKPFTNETGDQVAISFAGTQKLRTQIEQGAPADVFAAANIKHMKAVKKENLVRKYQVFAANTLALIVPKNNPAGIHGLGDLATKKPKIVLGVKNVPVGIYARKTLQKAEKAYGSDFKKKVLAHVVSFETNTKQVANKVALGEADAGIVYVTDVTPDIASKVKEIPIPDRYNVRATYTIAVVKNGKSPDAAKKWIHFVLSKQGQKVLAKHHLIPIKKQ